MRFERFLIFLSIVVGLEVCDETLRSDSSDASIPTIDVVVASLGGPNIDGDPEDLTWIPQNLLKPLYLYDRTNTASPFYIDTMKGNECLTYMKYILDHYDKLPRYAASFLYHPQISFTFSYLVQLFLFMQMHHDIAH
jgi:hypothetical protein